MSGVSRWVRYQASTASSRGRYRALSRTKPLSPGSRPVSRATARLLSPRHLHNHGDSIMLTHPTLEKLHTLRLPGMAKAFDEQLHMDDIDSLSTEERLGLMADRELTERDARRLKYRLSKAKLRHPEACVEDIDYRHPDASTAPLMTQLATSQWLRERLNILICGPHWNRQKLARVRLGEQSLS